MPDYEKLTVVKLRDELVARGLPKTGLKATLVQRLIEADEQSEKANLVLNEHSENGQEDESVTNAVLLGRQELREPGNNGHAPTNGPQSKEQDKDRPKDADVADANAPFQEQDGLLRAGPQTGELQEDKQVQRQASDPSEYVSIPGDTQSEKLSEQPCKPGKESEPYVSAPVRTLQASKDKVGVSTQTSLAGDETLEDSRKRKRSQSPSPSSTKNMQKRLRTDNGRPLVELPEDSVPEHTNPEERPNDDLSRRDPTYGPKSSVQTNGHASSDSESTFAPNTTSITVGQTDTERIATSQSASLVLEEMGQSKERNRTPTQLKSVESLMKPSPSDTRFKSLFTAPTNLEPSQSRYQDSEDRIVSPALHPATTALYVRELMRPLKVETLRDHLITLATPPDTDVNPNIMKDFFLDSVRTHCLVGFENISAASRVRSGLHDRVWPNERDRRQLWVDFVPEEKLKKWIDVEQTAGSRGQLSKRWEVVYEDEKDGIKSYLQEVGSNSGGLRAAKPARVDAGQGVQFAPPTGPRNSRMEPRSSQPRVDSGKGFGALDDLFTSTVAKPKLYYLPVSNAEADRRLAKLAAGRGGDRSGGHGDEMRRFSFEEGCLVDNGAEFGRGGHARGGGYSANYRGRGRGYRGDASRGSWDGWRDRRSGY